MRETAESAIGNYAWHVVDQPVGNRRKQAGAF
jgi:hypothetical protein